MNPLVISRKNPFGMGGLSRFYAELSSRIPEPYLLSPSSLSNTLRIPFIRPSHIYLCDATLLPLGVVLKALFRKPLIVSAHGLDITYPNPFYQTMLKLFLPKADAVVLDSNPAKKLLKPFHLHNKAQVIPLAASLSHLSHSSSVPFLVNEKHIVMTTVGNLVKRKGHTWFVENVMPFLPQNYIYVIVGEGKEREHIKDAIQKYDLEKRVFLVGRLKHSELSYVLKKTDIYVCPNQQVKDNFESFGIAVLEAAAMGIPVVATHVDGVSQTIHHGKNGIVVAPKAKSLTYALLNLSIKAKRQILGKKAKKYTNATFSWEKTTASYVKLFAELSKNRTSFADTSPS